MRRVSSVLAILTLLAAASLAMAQAAPPKPAKSTAGSQFDQAVSEAIVKIKKALYATQQPDGSWKPFAAGYEVGPTAMAVYALLEAGDNPQSKELAPALEWLAKAKSDKTYELGLRCNAWVIANSKLQGKYRKQLEADATILIKSTTAGSYSYGATGKGGGGDNSNSQYGLLGVWAAARALFEVSDDYWNLVMRHWMDCQQVDGGWTYGGNGESTGTMSAAGIASMFVCYDHLLYRAHIKCDTSADFKPIQRGLDWFDANFPTIMTTGQHLGLGGLYYLLYGVERVGLASGYKYFGTNDWYKMGAQKLLASMGANGYGADVTNAFALLFLIRGRNAVLFNKLEFPSADEKAMNDWNCRPRDLASLCTWISRTYETTVNWQIINLKVPVKEWHDAPILYIAGSKAPKLEDMLAASGPADAMSDIEKLRTYVLQGGTIFSCTECEGKSFSEGIRKVYAKLFPSYELVKLPPDHEIYTKKVYFDLGGKAEIYMMTNGVRPLVIHVDTDLPRAWQLNMWGSEVWKYQAPANIFAYVTDKHLRNRASHQWPDAQTGENKDNVNIVRLKWAGNWNPEPLALERFSRLFEMQTGKRVNVVKDVTAPKDLTLGRARIAILSGAGTLRLKADEQDALKDFVAKGNTLIVDAAGGDTAFFESARDMVEGIWGAAAFNTPAKTAPLLNLTDMDAAAMSYRAKTRTRVPGAKEPLVRVMNDPSKADRPAVVLSREDLTNAGLVGYQAFGVDGYDPGDSDFDGSAYRLMRNIVYSAAGWAEQATSAPTSTSGPATSGPTTSGPASNPTTSKPTASKPAGNVPAAPVVPAIN